MNFPADPVLRHQLPAVAQIIRDETWLEARRRGHTVPADDPVVRSNVCAAILRQGSPWGGAAAGRIAAELRAATPVCHFTANRAA